MNEYAYTKKCPNCSGPIFKYSDCSNDYFHLICGYTTFSYADVNKNGYIQKHVQVPNKKVSCGFHKIFTKNDLKILIDDDQDIYDNKVYIQNKPLFPFDNDDPVESDDDDDDDVDSDNGYDYKDYEEDDDDDDDDNESVLSED